MTAAATRSAIYTGSVLHRRVRPRVHRLRYRLFMLLIDLDEWDGLVRRCRWLTGRRFGLMSLRQADHGDRSATLLRHQVEDHLRRAGLEGGGAIRLLTMPRILGHGFNPLSVFFCHRRDGALGAILYEVSNTFGGRHTYLMPVTGPGPIRQMVAKTFHVSPFMDMDLTYRFDVSPPGGEAGERIRVAVTVADAQGTLLFTAFEGSHAPLTDPTLGRAWLSHPLLTLKVIAAIHWQALRLLAKGLRLRAGVTPAHPVTIGHIVETPPGARHA